MKILAFARTTPAYIALRKNVTRRDWSDTYFNRWRDGDQFQAWSNSPRVKGAHKIGEGVVLSVRRELTCEAPDSDWEAEGFAYMAEHGILLGTELSCAAMWRLWRSSPSHETWVIRFEVVSIEPGVKPENFFGRKA